MREIGIDKEFITLGQLLKITDVINSGGMAKWFLSEHEVYVNGELDDRRGRKLRADDKVTIPAIDEEFLMVDARGSHSDED
ncbi:S4 domain-containing protein YaaA [Planomicrobium sp. YIM 101495]|uniref:S4 domain-containing protein YaaA n=1 Tax=Planomicrobium sp. YIM 101495 TaxID=2665160 RepID=UPI0012B7C2C1|nr:S4 domain-containing protein YaaA [Planomicrobium sp. YIM 101495]MTD31228.1 S4 domain-containing protein YaaA [Planomicrobium sp. YIM 101495]